TVELNGANSTGSPSGLVIASSGSTVRGLVIDQFKDHGIEVSGSSNTIAGNFIGTDPTGTVARGNTFYGVPVTGANNTIGGTPARDRNVISGNVDGVRIIYAAATGNTVAGNYIGTDASGTHAVNNTEYGVTVVGASGNTVGGTVAGAGNVISA